MIKRCAYRKDEFEIEFEWRLPEATLNDVKQIGSFFKKIAGLPGVKVLKEKDYITGLIIPYKAFYELLAPFNAKGRDVQLADELNAFFSSVKR
ncbi:MAG: hypothetical protein Q7O04_06945 [Candidatus Omnitrophota bacterium]|nr:hypothetical protein [Candidatus Omnitrophota bacterium]